MLNQLQMHPQLFNLTGPYAVLVKQFAIYIEASEKMHWRVLPKVQYSVLLIKNMKKKVKPTLTVTYTRIFE